MTGGKADGKDSVRVVEGRDRESCRNMSILVSLVHSASRPRPEESRQILAQTEHSRVGQGLYKTIDCNKRETVNKRMRAPDRKIEREVNNRQRKVKSGCETREIRREREREREDEEAKGSISDK